MNITSRDSGSRSFSVGALTVFFDAQAQRFKIEQECYHSRRSSYKIEGVSSSRNSTIDINKLKDEHLVSDRRKLFESHIQKENSDCSIKDNRCSSSEMTSTCSDETTENVERPSTYPTEIITTSYKDKNRHSLEDIQKVRRSVMDTIIKYIQEGVSDDEEESTSTPPELSDNEIEECENMIKQLPRSWNHVDYDALKLPEGKGEDLYEDSSEYVQEDLNNTDIVSSEIASCIEEVSGEFNDLVALVEQSDMQEVQLRRNFVKSKRSSKKRKKGNKLTEDVVYSYSRVNSDESTKSSNENMKTENGTTLFDRASIASSSAYESDDSEDIFGTVTVLQDFIIEAYNHRKENVLYKLTLHREPIIISSSDEPEDSALDEHISESTSSNSMASETSLQSEIEIEVSINSEDLHEYQNEEDKVGYEEFPYVYENMFEKNHQESITPSYTNLPSNINGDASPIYANMITLNESNKKEGNYYENWMVFDNKTMEGFYYDKDFNPRITITCQPEENNTRLLDVPRRTDSQLSSPTPKKQHIIDELRETERKYLDGLEYVIHEYLKHFMNHPDVKHVGIGIRKLFGNIEDIYRVTQNFYKKLLDCGYSVDRIATLFIENEKLFLLCSDYMRNKSKTQYIYENYNGALSERQRQLNDKKTCDSYLLTPVQRPTRYKLLMENLCKDLRKHGEDCALIEEAITFIDRKISDANKLLAIDSIRGCHLDLTTKGPLLLKDPFSIKRKYRAYIFLFRDVVVFTCESKNKQDTFEYKDSILSTDLSLKHQTNSTSFVLINFPKSRESSKFDDLYTFEIEAANPQLCGKWVNEIRNILWTQLTTCKKLQASKSMTETQTIIRDHKFTRTLPAVNKKKKSTDSSRTSTFYISNDCP